MPRTFSYQEEGLAYTATIYEDPDNPGEFLADITVTEGAMDVNAIYFGDDDFSGESADLGGPLNMNGARLDGEQVQWDQAETISHPGLGPDGTDKFSYISSDDPDGNTLTLELDIDSLDEIDVLGIRATSTTTPEGSIKGVSDEPEEPEDPEDPTFEKVGFGVELGDNGGISNGIFLFEQDLPEGQDATFDNYVDLYVSQFGVASDPDLPEGEPDYSLSQVQSVIFYDLVPGDPNDVPQEIFRLDAPEGGFTSAEDLIAAYDDAIADGALDEVVPSEDGGLDLMAALSLDSDAEADIPDEEPMPEEDFEPA